MKQDWFELGYHGLNTAENNSLSRPHSTNRRHQIP